MYTKIDRQRDTNVFDIALLKLFEQWRVFIKQHRDKMELEYTDWLEDFCSYVWIILIESEEMGVLIEPLRPQ